MSMSTQTSDDATLPLSPRAWNDALLPHVTADRVTHLRNFYATPRINTIISLGQHYRCQWRFQNAFTHEYAILQAGALQMGLHAEPPDFTHGGEDHHWWHYEDESRILAWGLENEKLLSIFQAIFGLPWHPTRMHSPSAAPTPASFHCLKWRITGNDTDFTGDLLLDSVLLERLLEHNAWENAPTNSIVRDSIRTSLSVQMPIYNTTLDELSHFQPGDTLLVGSEKSCWNTLILVSNPAGLSWPLKRERHFVFVVQTTDKPVYQREHQMSADLSYPPEHMPHTIPTDSETCSITQLPIRLSFQLAQMEFTLGALERIQPGYVFSLPHSVSEVRMLLLANGQPIGHGELVTIGSQLGVRLLELNNHGF